MPNRKRKKNQFIFIPNQDINVSDWIPHYHKEFSEIESNSWFQIKCFDNPHPHIAYKYSKQIPTIPIESYAQQYKMICLTNSKQEPEFICTKKIKLYPSDDQKNILDTWFSVFAKMFNVTIAYLRQLIKKGPNLDIDEALIILNFRNIRSALKDQRKEIQCSTKNKKIPIHILDEAINQAVSNYKTCLTNLKLGNIRKFRIREWRSDKRRKIIKIESSFFRNGTFCSRIFPHIESSEPLVNIDRTCTLQYDSDTKKYLLLVPYGLEEKIVTKEKRSCGIDLGVRGFVNVYSENTTYSICEEAYKNSKIKNLLRKIDKINQLLNLKEKDQLIYKRRKKNNEIITDIEYKIINRNSLKRALRKYHRRVKNIIRDMHYKVAHELVHTFDKIYIGKLNTKKILSKSNIAISRYTKRMIGILSPYAFRQILKHMGNKYGTQVIEVDEYLTTKICSNCGRINELGKKKIHECECGMKADRDENAAKNILKVGLLEN